MPDEDKPQPLTVDEALARLDVVERTDEDGTERTVHCFRNPGDNILIGANWALSSVRERFEQHGAAVAGPAARKMKHGVVSGDHPDAAFFATKEA